MTNAMLGILGYLAHERLGKAKFPVAKPMPFKAVPHICSEGGLNVLIGASCEQWSVGRGQRAAISWRLLCSFGSLWHPETMRELNVR